MHLHRVRCLLMGGQACVLYGAAEFSRDTDFAILASDANLARLKKALEDLQAEVIAVPPFDRGYLQRGHAVHFRCRHPDAMGMRVDVMTRMREVAPFSALWKRRTTLEMPDGTVCHLLSLPDLLQAKKTQRDKDWPMLRRLVEAHYFQHRDRSTSDQIAFWFRELRTPELLIDLAKAHPTAARQAVRHRKLLSHAIIGDIDRLTAALTEEEQIERLKDRDYWAPLKQELELLRRSR